MSRRVIPTGAPKLAITDHKGFQITFSNGVCISVQWGPFNYCADYYDFNGNTDPHAPERERLWQSPDAEVALFWDDGLGWEWLTREAHAALNGGEDPGDDVLPALKPNEVAAYIAWAEARPARNVSR